MVKKKKQQKRPTSRRTMPGSDRSPGPSQAEEGGARTPRSGWVGPGRAGPAPLCSAPLGTRSHRSARAALTAGSAGRAGDRVRRRAATRAIVAPRVAIRQHLTTMWRLLLARGGRRRSDWPPDGPAASARRLPERAAPAESREGPGGARSGRGCECVRACVSVKCARALLPEFDFFSPLIRLKM